MEWSSTVGYLKLIDIGVFDCKDICFFIDLFEGPRDILLFKFVGDQHGDVSVLGEINLGTLTYSVVINKLCGFGYSIEAVQIVSPGAAVVMHCFSCRVSVDMLTEDLIDES